MELGSEFDLKFFDVTKKNDSILSYLKGYNTVFTDSGRSALRILLEYLNLRSVLIPRYICESVVDCFEGVDIYYYDIFEDMSLNVDTINEIVTNNKIDCIYLMHYFGKLQDGKKVEQLKHLKEANEIIIIEDTTHSFLSKLETIGDYCICSLRKWFAVPDGGVLYSTRYLPDFKLEVYNDNEIGRKLLAMALKNLQINDLDNYNAEYRKLFQEFDKHLDIDKTNRRISPFSIGMLKTISVGDEIERRLKNYAFVSEKLPSNIESVVLDGMNVPLAYPIYIKDRDKFREYLISNNIFCAVHWPVADYFTIHEKEISTKIISLPIDGRYSEKELTYMMNVINNYEGEK